MELCTSDEKIVTDKDASHPGKEDGPTGEHGDERRSIVDIIPWAYCYGDDSENEASSSDINPSRTQSSHIHSSRNAIQHDAKCKLRRKEREPRKEGASSCSGGHRDRLDV